MEKQIIIILKHKLNELSETANAEALRNVAKEEIQHYVLDFIYNHPKYSKWIMYGGSALRICHKLNRMSVDLDFEIDSSCTKSFLENLKKEVLSYFLEKYELGADFLTVKIVNNRGLLLRFLIGEELGINHPSKQVHVKIDFNHFVVAKTVTERIPINHGQLSFVIKTYNMSALMASKIAAVLLRGTRGVGKAVYQEKGRDIYDLLWYMEKKIIPDLDYLVAKGVDISDLSALFDKFTLQMNKVSNENLKQDLLPLFLNQNDINNWLANWHESYLRLVELYEIRTITNLQEIKIHQDFYSDNYSFVFIYNTEEDHFVKIIYTISDYWFDIKIPTKINNFIVSLICAINGQEANDKVKKYVTLFYNKNLDCFKKTNNIILGNIIQTKMIRMTANNLNRREQIVLNRSALLSCELEDLMK
ncbi:nucleotidyl transferase AbiEii/AbiGii toxin family protein [bacterium]|nr:nucleotidyl transferase AbiEii/AbiGii toxin family protein [bacterium]